MGRKRKNGEGTVRLRKDGRWEYRFFVDFEGNLEEERVQKALCGLQAETTALRILGTC